MKVTLIAAQSADGFITRHGQPGSGFASPEDQRYFRAALAEFDVSIMGSVTYLVDRTSTLGHLTAGRRRLVMTRDPSRFSGDAVPGRLEFTSEAAAALVNRLRAEGHRRCVLLGGSRVHSLFLDANLVDELWLTLEPRLFGGGVPLLASPLDFQMRLLGHERLEGSDTLLLKYSRQ
jgi:dihydrofolate reductase